MDQFVRSYLKKISKSKVRRGIGISTEKACDCDFEQGGYKKLCGEACDEGVADWNDSARFWASAPERTLCLRSYKGQRRKAGNGRVTGDE